jgi:hypothetical protein
MNAFFLVFILLLNKSWAMCLPDSYLAKSEKVFDARGAESAIEDFDNTMKESIPKNHELIITVDSLSQRVNADINVKGNEIVIQIMGGMLMHPEMKPEVLQLLLCHELGHFLGGAPLKSRKGWSSTEGQADYFSGLYCARMLGFNETMFLEASLKLTRIYAQVVKEPLPDLNRCDDRIADRTNYGYPNERIYS